MIGAFADKLELYAENWQVLYLDVSMSYDTNNQMMTRNPGDRKRSGQHYSYASRAITVVHKVSFYIHVLLNSNPKSWAMAHEKSFPVPF